MEGLHPVVAVVVADAVGPGGGISERFVGVVLEQGFDGGPSLGNEVLPGDGGDDPVSLVAPAEG